MDAPCFRPERWIESSPEQLKEIRRNLFTVSRRMPCQAHDHSSANMSHHRSSLVPVHGPALAKTSPCSRSTSLCWRYTGTLISDSPILNASGIFREPR